MSALFSSLGSMLRLGPREYVRQTVKLPLVKFIHETISLYKSRTKAGVNNVRDVLFRGTIIALITALLVWLSIFMYLAFYYVYVPSISHDRQVFLKFKPCGATYNCVDEKGLCSFPSAHVKLTKKQQLLMIGQSYKIHLELEMPESPTNRQLGMFMVCVEFMGKDGTLLNNSCRSAMLHYRGVLLDTLYKLMFSPFFIFGSAEEKQTVKVELFADYEEKYNEPVTDIYVEVQSRHIEIYSAKFSVNAQFTGIRYVMFHWPVLSAAMGITANLFFIAIVCLISWYQIIHSEEYLEYIESNNKKGDNEDPNANADVLPLPKVLNNILDTDLGAIPFIPMFVAFDMGTSLFSYFTRNIFKASSIPIRMIRFAIEFSEYNQISQMENNISNVSNSNGDLLREGTSHSESSYSLDYDDTSLIDEKDIRFRDGIKEDYVENINM